MGTPRAVGGSPTRVAAAPRTVDAVTADPTSATTSSRPVRQNPRLTAAVVAAGLVVVGIAVSRVAHPLADPAGDALYAMFVYALLVVVAPRARPLVVAAVAYALCAAVELAQLTGVPAAIVEVVPVARYALGTTFVAVDLLAYAVGVTLAVIARFAGHVRR